MATASLPDPFDDFRFFMRCTICLDSFTTPRTLPCLHTFCTSCLQCHVDATLSASLIGDAYFMCPTCREQISLPRDGVYGFRRDFRMEQVREILTRNADAADGNNNNECRCSICMGSFDTSSFHCKECNKSFCDMCTHIHGQIPVFSGHIVEEHNPVMTRVDQECSLHPNDMLVYICEDCVKPVCSTCVMKHHGDHVVVEKTKGIRDMLGHVDFQHKTLQTRRAQLITMLDTTKDGEKQMRKTRSALAGQVKAKTREVIEDVHKQERKLLTELDERTMEEEGRLGGTRQHLESVIHDMTVSCDKARDLLCADTGVCLIQQYHDMERSITQLVEDSMVFDLHAATVKLAFIPTVVRPRLGRISVDIAQVCQPISTGTLETGSSESASGSGSSSEPDLNDSGIATAETSPVRYRDSRRSIEYDNGNRVHPMDISLTAKLGKYGRKGGEFSMPRDVCFMNDSNHFAVCDTNNERIQIFDIHGLLVSVVGQGRVRPWGVAYSNHGELMITDNVDKCVKVYNTDGELLRRLGSFLCPCGITVTTRNHVIVTDFFSTCAYVMDSSGEIRRQIRYRTAADKHACGASRIAVTSHDDIIISDVSNASLKAYNKHGRHMWTVSDFTELLSPQGICITKDDIILVGDSVNHRIAQFNTNGEFLGTVNAPGNRVKEPTSLAISNDCMLVIGRMKANQIRVYKMKNSSR